MKTWRERCVEARARGTFTFEDVKDAGMWSTCAVGEHHQAMPGVVVYFEHDRHGPIDGILAAYGGDHGFYNAVAGNDFDAADVFLDEIEDRVLELKREATS